MPIDLDNIETSNMNSGKFNIGNFFNHIFNFDNENKANMLNILQYIILGIIPIVLILKTIKLYIPEEDDKKGSLEVALEVAIQLVAIFFGIWFIDKFIRYFPTYSGTNYHKFNETNFIFRKVIFVKRKLFPYFFIILNF